MVQKKREYPQRKFDNRKDDSLKELHSSNYNKLAPKLDKDHDLLFQETIKAIKENQDFLKKLTDDANEQMSRTIFKVSPS